MADKYVARAGMNTFKCVCKDGTVFIPVSMGMIAKMRCGEALTVKGKCHSSGHIQEYNLVVWPPFPNVLGRAAE